MRPGILAVLAACFLAALPHAAAQDLPDAQQVRIEVVIGEQGDASVTHRVAGSAEDAGLEFVGGPAVNLRVTDSGGNEIGGGAVIPAGSGEVTVEYDLHDFVRLADGVWMLEFLYLDTVVFTVPDGAEVVMVNGQPLYTGTDKRFACHGCHMTLEYMTGEPANAQTAVWEDREFPVEIRTHARVGDFVFDQAAKSISFDAEGAGAFLAVTFETDLLGGPYTVLHGGDAAEFYVYETGEGQVGIAIRPAGQGAVTIMGTTVIPEFSALVPLAAGFAAVLAYPLIRRLQPAAEPHEQNPYSSIRDSHRGHLSP